MSYKKMRTILIILLIIINAFLTANYYSMTHYDKQIYNEKITQQTEILENYGIVISESTLKEAEIFSNYAKVTPISTENIIALLGSDTEIDGEIFISQLGTATLSDKFEFNIVLNQYYDISEIEKILIDAGFTLELSVKSQSLDAYFFHLKIIEETVSNVYFEVKMSDRNTSISGNFISNISLIDAQILDDPFAIILEVASEFQGEIYEIFTKHSYEYPGFIVPCVYFQLDHLTVLYNPLIGTYQFIEK